jgi:Spy/CpxP family protein refolding chaperone
MQRKKITAILISSALLAGLALTPALAGYGPGHCDGADDSTRQQRMSERMEQHLSKMTAILDLTEVQQAQIRDILENKQKQHQALSQQRCADREQRQEMKSAGTFDEAEFRAMAGKKAAQRIDMQVEKMKTKQQIFALLTTEQQEKAEIIFQSMDRHGPGHGRGMRH